MRTEAGDSGTVDGVRGAVYGALALGHYRFAGAASAGYERFGVTRPLPTFARVASSTYDGWTVAASAEASRPFAVAGTTSTNRPPAALSLVLLYSQPWSVLSVMPSRSANSRWVSLLLR